MNQKESKIDLLQDDAVSLQNGIDRLKEGRKSAEKKAEDAKSDLKWYDTEIKKKEKALAKVNEELTELKGEVPAANTNQQGE